MAVKEWGKLVSTEARSYSTLNISLQLWAWLPADKNQHLSPEQGTLQGQGAAFSSVAAISAESLKAGSLPCCKAGRLMP